MSKRHTDISDDEIRVISSGNKELPTKRLKKFYTVLAAIIILVLCGIVAIVFFQPEDDNIETMIIEEPIRQSASIISAADSLSVGPAYSEKKDTVVNGVRLTILTPRNAVPVLEIGEQVLDDQTVVLAAQAADIRSDNGTIAGACVIGGELISKGCAKAGFCAIINGETTIGVAEATPMFEQALSDDGYFFRQYPLVIAGQIVENKPRGKAIRKALAEIGDDIAVVYSHRRLTFHDFSQALVDAGVRNAIYLVGSRSSGFYVDADGNRFSFGNDKRQNIDNINFIVWHQR